MRTVRIHRNGPSAGKVTRWKIARGLPNHSTLIWAGPFFIHLHNRIVNR